MEFLFSIELDAFSHFLWLWGVIGALSAVAIYVTGLMPISSRGDNSLLNFLGTIDKRRGWIIMETPVLVAVIGCYLLAGGGLSVSLIFIVMFVIHYSNRALIYPYRIRVEGKRMAISMVLMSMLFYITNGYLIGYYFGALRDYSLDWLRDPRFLTGMALFVTGMIINVQSDNILIRLRQPGETGYKIPRGGLFRFVSCPNYFGEILEWIGFAVMSWSLLGVVYALWVGLPLLAQALATHRWYRSRFKSEYPSERKAVIPFVL